MLPLGMVLTFVGYGVGTYGYVLVKGYNITLRQWFSPLHPWQGPLDKAGMVPPGQIFPGGKGAAPGQPNPIQQQQQKNLRTEPNPHGFVQ